MAQPERQTGPAIFAVAISLILVITSAAFILLPSKPQRQHIIGLDQTTDRFSSDQSVKAEALNNLNILLTAQTGIKITKGLLPNSTFVSRKRILLAFDFLFEEDKTLAQRNMLRLGYKENTPNDVDILFLLRDPYNHAQDRLFTEEQAIYHDIYSQGRPAEERLYRHSRGPSSALFPQDIAQLFGNELPEYDFIVQTGFTSLVSIQPLLSLVESWNASQIEYSYHSDSKTALMTGMFAKAVEIDAENKNTLQDLHKYVKSGNVTLRSFNNSIFAECDKVVNDSIVFLKNCDNMDKKLKAFQDLKYLSKNKIQFIPTSINSLLIPPPKGSRKLLLGVFTYYSDGSTLRRTLLRFFYTSLFNVSSRNADLRFVMGIPQSEAQKRLILEEQTIFGDILLIDTPEAMNDGKSYYYIQQTIGMMDNGTFPTYEFIAKVDDDTLPNIRGIMKKIAEYDYQKDIYFGRAFVNNVENFGLLYGFSQELARKLANLNPKKGDVKSYEDYMMGLLVKKVSNTTRTIWDMIDTKYESGHFGWSIPLSKEILAVHTLKTSTEFWNYLMLYESIFALNG